MPATLMIITVGHVFFVHTRIAVVTLHLHIGQDWGFLPNLHIPDGRHVAVFLRISNHNTYIACLHSLFVYHWRALHGIG